MCTAITFKAKDLYFGRTLDYDKGFGESVVITPRNFPLEMRHTDTVKKHYAIIGMAVIKDNFPLYYDAFNEYGLCMAGLNFVGNAKYSDIDLSKINVAQFELIPYILSKYKSINEVKKSISNLNIVATDFNSFLSSASLHWILADDNSAITLESTSEGIKVYENTVGVLTNNPEFDKQLFSLNNYMSLSTKNQTNEFSDKIDLVEYSRGMGAIGLPGDLSSQSRFIRACFTKLNSYIPQNEHECVVQFFHIMSSVSQTKGVCVLENGNMEHTLYTSCCNITKGIYYYKTYYGTSVSAVRLDDRSKSESNLKSFGLNCDFDICYQN